MSLSIIISVAIGVSIYYTYITVLYPLFVSSLARIPLAHPLAITPWWIKYYRRDGNQAIRVIRAAHERHGPIVRLGPTEVSINSYEAGHKVYIERGGFAKPMWWANAFINYGSRNLVSMVGGPGDKNHTARKRDMGNIYSKSFLVTSPQVRTITSTLLSRIVVELDKISKENEGVTDIFDFNSAVNADFAAAYLFGLDCGTDFVSDRKQRMNFFKRHSIFLLQQDGAKEAQAWFEKYFLERCEATAQSQQKRDLGSSEKKTDTAVVYNQLATHGVLGVDLASEVLDHLIAGSEGPRTICTYMQYELSRVPSLQDRLRKEVQSLIPASHPTALDLKALDALPLLEAILAETLRVYAITAGPQWRAVPAGGTTLNGVYIPEGTTVHVSIAVMHRDESAFPEAEKWLPERWIGRTSAELDQMRRMWWPFSKGSRVCLGKDFTTLVMKLFIATLYARYKTTVVGENDMRQDELFLGQPMGKSLVLKVERV